MKKLIPDMTERKAETRAHIKIPDKGQLQGNLAAPNMHK